MIVRKTAAELEKMRRSGLLVFEILQKMKEIAVEGASTMDLEIAAEKMIADAGAKPAFKGYYVPAAGEAYRFVLCTSVNEEIVHGMPNARRVLKKGDIVSIDTGVKLDGYYGDSAVTVPIGEISEQTEKLLEVTRESLELAIDQVRAGNRLFDICGTVEQHVTVERVFGGAGVCGPWHRHAAPRGAAGSELRGPQERESAAEGRHGAGGRADGKCGTAGSRGVEGPLDGGYQGWSNSAHFEHCIAVTENGPWVLTRP